MYFLTKLNYTRVLFNPLTPLSSPHPPLLIRCSPETEAREIRQLLVRVTKETGLHRALGEELGGVSRPSGEVSVSLNIPAVTKPLSCLLAREGPRLTEALPLFH